MHIRPAQARDLADLATIATDALFDDEYLAFLAPYRHQHPLCLRERFLRVAKRRFYSGVLLLAAVTDDTDPWWDGTEKIVGYLAATSSKHQAEVSNTSWFSWNALELQLLRLEELFRWYARSDRSLSRENYLEFLKHTRDPGPLDEIKDHWHVNHLSVHPSYQRRGIGSALIKYIKSVATTDNLPIALLASVQGRPLYEKEGFADLGPVAYAEGRTVEAMAWYPEISSQ